MGMTDPPKEFNPISISKHLSQLNLTCESSAELNESKWKSYRTLISFSYEPVPRI